jgi:hypothetical protein
MKELLKKLLRRWLNEGDKNDKNQDTNAQNNYAHGNEQYVYQTDDGAIQHIYNAEVYFMSNGNQQLKGMKSELSKVNLTGKLTEQQIKVIEHLIITVNAMRVVLGEPVNPAYLPAKLAEISSVAKWQDMPANFYDRAVKYLMKCAGFVSER